LATLRLAGLLLAGAAELAALAALLLLTVALIVLIVHRILLGTGKPNKRAI
jgi:hypothetical protein